MRKDDRNDLVIVLPDHAFHVDGDAADACVATRLLGASSKNRLDFIDCHPGFDLGVVVFGDWIAAAANDEKKQSQAEEVFELEHDVIPLRVKGRDGDKR